jgi:hypothetical protein
MKSLTACVSHSGNFVSESVTKPKDNLELLLRCLVFGLASFLLVVATMRDIKDLQVGHPQKYREFGTFWASGFAAAHGQNPYSSYPLTWKIHPIFGNSFLVKDVNLQPPCMLPFFEFVSHFDPQRGVRVWSITSLAAFIFGTALIFTIRRGELQKRQIVWLLLAPAVTDTQLLGQDYVLLFLFAAIAWAALERDKYFLADLCIGILVAMKPNLLLWPLLLFLAGYRRSAVRIAVVAGSITLMPVFRYGPGIYRLWLEAAAKYPHSMIPTDVSITAFFIRLGIAPLGIVVTAVLMGSIMMIVALYRPKAIDIAPMAICTAILCSPIAWYQYVVMLAPFFVARRWDKKSNLAALLLFVPSIIPALSMAGGPFVAVLGGLPYFAAFWIILVLSVQRLSDEGIGQTAGSFSNDGEPVTTREAVRIGYGNREVVP